MNSIRCQKNCKRYEMLRKYKIKRQFLARVLNSEILSKQSQVTRFFHLSFLSLETKSKRKEKIYRAL